MVGRTKAKTRGREKGKGGGDQAVQKVYPLGTWVVWGPRKLAPLISSLGLPVSVQMNLGTPPSEEPWGLGSLCIFLIEFHS